MKKITVLALCAVFFANAYSQENSSVKSNFAHWSLGIKGGFDYYRVTPYGDNFISQTSWAAPNLFVQYDINPYFGLGLDAGMFNYDRSRLNATLLGKTIDVAFYGSVNLLNVFSIYSPVVGLYGNAGFGAGFWNNEIPSIEDGTTKGKGISPMGFGSLALTFNIAPAWELFLEGQYRSYTNQWMGGEGHPYPQSSADAVTALLGVRFKIGANSAKYGHARNMSDKDYRLLNAPQPESDDRKVQDLNNELRNLKNQVAVLQAQAAKNETARIKALEDEVAALKELNRLSQMKEGETVSASFDNIEFEFNSSVLTQTGKDLLDLMVSKLSETSWSSLKVTGHTDNIGTAGYNRKLSKERAASVKKYLVNKGIAAANIATDGMGFDKPIEANDTAANRAKNRRVEFTVVK